MAHGNPSTIGQSSLQGLVSGKVAQSTLIACFVGALLLPLGAYLTGRETKRSLAENRKMAPLPSVSWSASALEEFPRQFEAHYRDHFGFRSNLIHAYDKVKLAVLGDSTHPGVIIGKEGFHFYAFGRDGKGFFNPQPFTQAELDHWQKVLEARHDYLAKRGCQYVFMVAPEKQTIHPEYLPSELQHLTAKSTRLDQLMNHLKDHPKLLIVDLRPVLREAGRNERLYHLNDSHWNERGAYCAYQEMMRQISRHCPDLEALPRSAFEEEQTVLFGGDLAILLGLGNRLKEKEVLLKARKPAAQHRPETVPAKPALALGFMCPLVYEIPNSNRPRCILISDSFGQRMIPQLSESFSRFLFLPQHTLDPDIIEKERPDLVIQEIVERKLTIVDATDPLPTSDPVLNLSGR